MQELAGEVTQERGSIICRDLLGLNKKGDEPLPEERTETYYKKRPCAEIVHHAAEVVGKQLKQIMEEKA